MSGDLARLAELIHEETGIVVKPPQLPALEAALARAAPGADAESYLAELPESPARGALVSRLIDEVAVQETYFFRESAELEAIDWPRLHESAKERGLDMIRVWVAACATGEEAYSLALLAGEAFGSDAPPITILATDISAAALERSAAGSYSPRSLRGVPDHLLERHFVAEGRGRHRLRGPVKSLVHFRRHNLVNDPYPPPGEVAFDLITCRNVLIYFNGPTVERVITSLETSLTPGGQLILGAADRLSGMAGMLDRVGAALPPAEARPPRPPTRRPLRRPLGVEPVPAGASVSEKLERALGAADAGELDAAITISAEVLADDPLNADAYFINGMAELSIGRASAAIEAFRRALYIDPSFGLAAFKLGRAHDTRGDARAARRSYQQALRMLDPDDERHRVILDKVDLGDIAAACRVRLRP